MAATIKDDAPYKDFAERLRKLRENAGLTRAQLGEKVGVSGRSIINYENGERIPFGDTCAKMAETFGITTDELLGVSNPQLEMAKAEALDSMRSTNGKSGAARLEHALNTVGSVLAGGELSEAQAQEYIFEMQKMAFLAQQRLRETHTNKRYQATVSAKAAETKTKVDELDNKISAITSGNDQ